MRWERRSWFPIAMQRLDEREVLRALLQGKVRVQNVGIVGEKRREIDAVLERPRRDLDDARGGPELGPRLREHGYTVPEGRQRLDQGHDDALGSAIAFHR